MIRPIRMLSSVLTVGGWTMLSRVAGLIRDLLIGAFLGAGPVADAFLAAFALPNLFRRFFAEGAFNTAFVPLFSKKLGAETNAKEFAQDAFSGLASILIVLTVLAQLFMPFLVYAMVSGYAQDERFELTVFLGRICFPYILFVSLAALLNGVLNATGRFAAAAAAPVLLNAVLIGAMIAAYYLGWRIEIALAWGVVLAGVGQFYLVWVAAKNAGFNLGLRLPRMTDDLKVLAKVALPAALAGGVVQINILVGRQVASVYEGAVSWLYYADRLYQLPLGVIGIAIGIVLLPDLSRKLAASDEEGGKQAFNRATEYALLFTLPAAMALALIPQPIISVLFERGAFTEVDTQKTALALAIYGVGLPAFVLQKTLQPLYFARQDTVTPFKYALVAMVLNAVLAIGMSYWIGFLAAALATTAAAIAMVALLVFGTRNMGDAAKMDARFWERLPRIGLATLIMGACIYGIQYMLEPMFAVDGLRYLALLGLVLVSIVTYFGAAIALGAVKTGEIRQITRRR